MLASFVRTTGVSSRLQRIRRGASHKTLREPRWQQACQIQLPKCLRLSNQASQEIQDQTLCFVKTTLVHNLNGVGKPPMVFSFNADQASCQSHPPWTCHQTLFSEVLRSIHHPHSFSDFWVFTGLNRPLNAKSNNKRRELGAGTLCKLGLAASLLLELWTEVADGAHLCVLGSLLCVGHSNHGMSYFGSLKLTGFVGTPEVSNS